MITPLPLDTPAPVAAPTQRALFTETDAQGEAHE